LRGEGWGEGSVRESLPLTRQPCCARLPTSPRKRGEVINRLAARSTLSYALASTSAKAGSMAGLVVTIAQRKGGAGKTTLAAQLAVAWARQGLRVALLDIDPQGSRAAWVDLRRMRLGAEASGFEYFPVGAW